MMCLHPLEMKGRPWQSTPRPRYTWPQQPSADSERSNSQYAFDSNWRDQCDYCDRSAC